MSIDLSQAIRAVAGACGCDPDVESRAEEIRVDGGIGIGFFHLHGPIGLGPFDLFKVRDASTLLADAARLDEVWNRYRRQHGNDRNDDHNFHQREARFKDVICFHLLSHSRRERR